MAIVIREAKSGTRLAEGNDDGQDVVKYEGNLYFAPGAVDRDVLKVTERTYTCPYKGVCHYVDFVAGDGQVTQDVAWVYADPKPGHEVIKDRYGFYAGKRGATRQE
jgi:uncharacterized protein (DUF427 family)